MAAQMILRASGSADSLSAVACNGTVTAVKVELAAAGATAGLYATRGAFRALAIAWGALGLVGGAAYLWYSKGVGLTKYLLSPATHRAPRHVRQRAKGLKEEWRGTKASPQYTGDPTLDQKLGCVGLLTGEHLHFQSPGKMLTVAVEDGRPLPVQDVQALARACDINPDALAFDSELSLVPATSP